MVDNSLTLRQGLEQFYKAYQGHLSHEQEGIPDDVRSFFKSHDIAHVLFGCDISMFGEGSVKIWTIFGTTLGFWKHIKAYNKASAFELAMSFTLLHVLKNIFKLLIAIPVLILRAKRMNKRWPWTDYDSYLDMAIVDIRKEFNIKVLQL